MIIQFDIKFALLVCWLAKGWLVGKRFAGELQRYPAVVRHLPAREILSGSLTVQHGGPESDQPPPGQIHTLGNINN